jgi:hypothetical protein
LPSGNGDHRGELIRARYEREESGMRTGEQYLAALRDDRAIFVDGERVADVTEHEAFRGIVSTVASLYDIAADPANDMSFTEPTTGLRANKIYMIPRNVDDLRARRAAIERWARASNGLLGRGPDHVAAFLAAFASAPSVFENGRAGFGDNLTAFYRRALADDLYLSYVIIPPQVDRSKTAQGQEEAFLQVGVLKEQDGGIVVRGAQMLGTAARSSCRSRPPGSACIRGGRTRWDSRAPSTIRCRRASTRPMRSLSSTTCSSPGSTSSYTATSSSRGSNSSRPPLTCSGTPRPRSASP